MCKRALIALDGSPVAEIFLPFIFDIAGPLDIDAGRAARERVA
jgi:hypothetical protein